MKVFIPSNGVSSSCPCVRVCVCERVHHRVCSRWFYRFAPFPHRDWPEQQEERKLFVQVEDEWSKNARGRIGILGAFIEICCFCLIGALSFASVSLPIIPDNLSLILSCPDLSWFEQSSLSLSPLLLSISLALSSSLPSPRDDRAPVFINFFVRVWPLFCRHR